MSSEHEIRCRSVGARLAERGADFLLVTPSTDMLYLCGYAGEPSERLIALLLGPGGVTLVTPRFEAERLASVAPFAGLEAWDEIEDPYARVAGLVRAAGRPQPVVAVGEHTWAGPLLALQAALPEARFVPAQPLLAEQRLLKSPAEIELLRTAGALNDEAFARLVERRLAGRSEREVAELLATEMRRAGLESVSFLIVASGPNAALPHHEPGERRLSEGDAVVLDFGGTYRHYQSDMTRTICVGEPALGLPQVHDFVRQAQELGVRAVRPGVAAEEVDAAARAHLAAAGLGQQFLHRTGHGLGLDVHEEPYIVAGNRLPLRPGMVFSVEPGAYLTGKFGVRVEDIVVVTPKGAERLNNAPRGLLSVR
ncbi:MAG: M24 family metallopeptidase [Chloroflexota bacterium]